MRVDSAQRRGVHMFKAKGIIEWRPCQRCDPWQVVPVGASRRTTYMKFLLNSGIELNCICLKEIVAYLKVTQLLGTEDSLTVFCPET